MTSTIFSKAAVLVLLIGCGDDNPTVHSDASPGSDAPPMGKTFKQVEHLARPGINEAFLFSQPFMAGYNATAPSFAGVDPGTLGMVVGEAKTVLKALYLGGCLLNGTIPGVTADTGVHPAGIKCHAIGTALWVENSLSGVTLTPESEAAAQAYADKVFSQFEPDVLRVDTGVPVSSYLSLCGDASSTPLLCGGRFLDDDVIDVTYNYVLAGAAVPTGSAATYNQVSALVSDGVAFYTDQSKNKLSATPADPNNPAQFHPLVSQAFPYSAAPF
jgi:hypothetical protein